MIDQEPLSRGNAAKLYCLERIDELAGSRESLSIVDLGCGDGRNFVELLRRRPNVHYSGVEPSAAACEAARAALSGLSAEIVHSTAADARLEPADVVVSFSVLEHVYRRAGYVSALARHLKPGGVAYVNYDAGHFLPIGTRQEQRVERWKGRLGRLLARVGSDRRYQRFVTEAEFHGLVDAAGLRIVEAKAFNTDLKNVYKALHERARDPFMRLWLELELAVDGLGLEYYDALAPVFRTRNFVLSRK